MDVPFNSLQQQYQEVQLEVDAAVSRVLSSGWYILGEALIEFEEQFARYLSPDACGYVVGVNSGTDAIKLSLRAAGVASGDEVITVANTAIPTVTAICSIGSIPVFCDVDPETWLMDPSRLVSCITSKTKAIVPVHLYGQPCQMDEIMTIANQYCLVVVEDVAQASGARWRTFQCGTIGHYGAFSFYPTQNLGACGDGGAIFVHSQAEKDHLCRLRNYGQSGRYLADEAFGENSRLDELQAAILTAKLPFFEGWNLKRRELAQYYHHELSVKKVPVLVQKGYPEASPAPHLLAVRPVFADRDKSMAAMLQMSVQTLVHYPYPIYRQPAFLKFFHNETPVAEKICASVLSLPFHQYLSNEQICYVVDCLVKSLKA